MLPLMAALTNGLTTSTTTGATIVGIIRHERTTYSPGPAMHLNHGDTLMLLGDSESIHKARELLHGHPV